MSVLYWYCLMKAIIKSFRVRMREASKLVYQMIAAPTKLSWKKCINSFSSLEYDPIFWQYIFKWFLGQVVPLYLSKSGTLNFGEMTTLGTKHKSVWRGNHKTLQPPLISLQWNQVFLFLQPPKVVLPWRRVAVALGGVERLPRCWAEATHWAPTPQWWKGGRSRHPLGGVAWSM